MGREANIKPNYEILAYITLDKNRVLGGGNAIALMAQNEEELKTITADITKALKADVVKLKCGDYMIIRV